MMLQLLEKTVIFGPDPTLTPSAHPFSYQNQFSPVARVPPFTDKVVFPPEQTDKFVAEIEEAATETGSTITDVFVQLEVLQDPSARTK